MARSYRATENAGTVYSAYNDQKRFLNGLSSDEVQSFVTRLCTTNKLPCLTERDALSAISTLATTHPEIVALNIVRLISSLVKMLSICPRYIPSISEVVSTLATNCIDHVDGDHAKGLMLSSICSPFSDCLLAGNCGLSFGSSTVLAEIVKSVIWQSASLELVITLCEKTSDALQDTNYRTTALVSLACALSEMNGSALKVYGNSVISSCLMILDGCQKIRAHDMALCAIQILHCLLEEMDVSILDCEVSNILDAFRNYENDYSIIISNAAFEAGKLANDLKRKKVLLEPVDGKDMSKRDSQVISLKRHLDVDTAEFSCAKERKVTLEDCQVCLNHEIFKCPLDKSRWTSLHTYAKQNEDLLTENIHTPGSRDDCPHFQLRTSNTLKLILRRIHHKIKMMNDSGLTLGGQYSARNIMIDCYNNVKFGCLQDGQLKKFSDDLGKEDSHTFVHMVKREVFELSKSPDDLSSWLLLIDECDTENDELAKYHISTMDEHASVTAFFLMVDALDEMEHLAKPVYKRVTQMLDESNKYSNWQGAIGETYGNKYLGVSITYRSKEGHDPYSDDLASLLLLLRNSRQHSAKWIEEYFMYIICQHLPDLPSDLQRAMYWVGYISRLILKFSMP